MPPSDTLLHAGSASHLWTLLFAAVLSIGFALRLWLLGRQVRHISRHANKVPAPFDRSISLTAHRKAADYNLTKARIAVWEAALSAGVVLGWTLLGGLNALHHYLLDLFGTGLLQQVALLVCFAVIGGLIELPLSVYQTFGVEQRFGFNKLTWRLWLSDSAKGLLIGALIGIPTAALIFWIMSSTGPYWWLWAWCFWMGLILLLMVIYPTLIAPLFNKFQPLDDADLSARVGQLMQRCGFAAKGLYVMNGSRRSAHANAYFTGFGAAKRVVFYDTLLRQLHPGEVEAVLAHELGHFKHRHIAQRLVTMFAISLAGFALLGWLSTRLWFYTGLGVQPSLDSLINATASVAASNNALALLLLLLVAPLFMLFVSPWTAHQSRKHEFEADAYAVSQTNGADLSSALLKLYNDNASTLTPDPWYVKFYYSHPPATQRLARMSSTPATSP